MRSLVVGRDAQDDRAGLREARVLVAEPAGLLRAYGRVVLGIAEEDDGRAAKRRALHALGRIVRELELGRLVAHLEIRHARRTRSSEKELTVREEECALAGRKNGNGMGGWATAYSLSRRV